MFDLLKDFCKEKGVVHAVLAFNFNLNDGELQVERLALSNGGEDFLEVFGRVADETEKAFCEELHNKVGEMAGRKNGN